MNNHTTFNSFSFEILPKVDLIVSFSASSPYKLPTGATTPGLDKYKTVFYTNAIMSVFSTPVTFSLDKVAERFSTFNQHYFNIFIIDDLVKSNPHGCFTDDYPAFKQIAYLSPSLGSGYSVFNVDYSLLIYLFNPFLSSENRYYLDSVDTNFSNSIFIKKIVL